MTREVTAEFLPYADVEDVDYSTDTSGTKTEHDKKLEDLLDSLNNDPSAMVSVYRQAGTGKESMNFLDTFPPDKYSQSELLMYLKNSYGTGDYRIQIRVNGKLRANKLVSIEAPRTEKKTASEMGEIASILETVMRRQDQLFQSIQNKPQESEADFLSKMAMYRDLFAGNQPPQVDPIENLTKTMGLLTTLGLDIGGQKEDDGFGSLIDKLSPLLEYAMNPANKPASTPQQTQTKPDESKMRNFAQNIRLKMGIAFLITAAKENKPIHDYALSVVDQVGRDDLMMMVDSGDYVTNLSNINPEVAKYREWFNNLGIEIKKILTENGKN